MCYLISKQQNKILVKIKDDQFCVKNMKMKKRTKFFDLPERRFELQVFSDFPVYGLNFHWRGEIKSRQRN